MSREILRSLGKGESIPTPLFPPTALKCQIKRRPHRIPLNQQLRMVRQNATDLVRSPPDSEEVIFLAHPVGYTTEDWQAGTRHLQADIEQYMKRTQDFFCEDVWKAVRTV